MKVNLLGHKSAGLSAYSTSPAFTALRACGVWGCLLLAVTSGCYSAARPQAARLDPLGMYRNQAGPSASEMVAAPAVHANPEGVPSMASQVSSGDVVTLPANEIQTVSVTENVPGSPTLPTPPADVGGATAEGTQTVAARLPMLGAGCATGACNGAAGCGCGACGGAACAPATTWCPPGLNQYCVNPQEFLCDGGDRLPHVKVSVDGEPLGLGTQDTVVTYENANGSPEVSASNCVCVYAPRFAAVRKVSAAALGGRAIAAVGFENPVTATPVESRIPGVVVTDTQGPLHRRVVRGPDAYKERNRATPLVGEIAPILARDVLEVFAGISILETGVFKDADLALLKAGTLAAEIWTNRDVVDVIIDEQIALEMTLDRTPEELKVYEVRGHGKVRICKVADRGAAQPGDTVTFVLRVDNVGDAAVKSVVVSDSLTTRLEYIPDSQACTKGAIFETKPNDVGSSIVTWKFTDELKVGEGCIIRFRCKVR